jgi:2-C-methyl-D-erythritol 4-phosphate cytidylyltransferase
MSPCVVIIPAGGSGSRFGGPVPKQFSLLDGVPLLHHTLRIFDAHPRIFKIYPVLSALPEDLGLAWPFSSTRVQPLACAGPTRAQTVLNALQSLQSLHPPDTWVLVHDAARPCLSRAALDRLIQTLQDDPVGGLLAIPLSDTLKRQNDHDCVATTLDRTGLWAAQTPQMFRLGSLLEALRAHPAATDESSALEGMGLEPRLVLGEITNLKVTWPADLIFAQAILEVCHAHRSGI